MNNKKVYGWLTAIVAATLSFSFTACDTDTGSKDGSLVMIPSKVVMHIGDSARLITSRAAEAWSSEDDNVATVNDEGIVVGQQLGTVRIKAVSGSQEAFSTVSVIPVDTTVRRTVLYFFETPILDFGASLNAIMEKETHELRKIGDDNLEYQYETDGHAYHVVYWFEENYRLTGIVMVFGKGNKEDYENAREQLNDEYHFLSYEKNIRYYADDADFKKCSITVMLYIRNGYTTVQFNPHTPE